MNDDTRGEGTGMELWEAIQNTLEHYVPTSEELEEQFKREPLPNDSVDPATDG